MINEHKNKQLNLSLHREVKNGNVVSIRSLLNNGVNVNARDKEGKTPIHWAINYCVSLNTIQMLIDYGADVNARDNYGFTPFYTAVSGHKKSITMLQMLIDSGADINVSYDRGLWSPLYRAAYYGNLDVIRFLIKYGAIANSIVSKSTPIHAAIYCNYMNNNVDLCTKSIRLLVDGGIPINTCNNDNETPLFLAVMLKSNIDVIHSLIDNDINVKKTINVQDKYGKTPLLCELDRSETLRINVINALLKNGANIHICDENGNSASKYANLIKDPNVKSLILMKLAIS